MTIGNSEVMLSEESLEWDSPGPQTLGGTSVSISLMVPDVDAVVARAVEAGATLAHPVRTSSTATARAASPTPSGTSG